MPANWLNFGNKKPPETDQVVEITPDSLKTDITGVKTELEAKLTALGESINDHPTLKAMQEFLDGQKASKDAAARARVAQQQQEQNAEFENVDATTRQYVETSLRPIADAALWQQGTELRRNIFENAEVYPYYTGSIKDKVDEIIDKQPASLRANADVIRNAYKIVIFDNKKEIDDNKHKSRFSSASSSGSGTGGPQTKTGTELPVLTAQMKHVAAKMGMTEAEYAAGMKELQDAGEYV